MADKRLLDEAAPELTNTFRGRRLVSGYAEHMTDRPGSGAVAVEAAVSGHTGAPSQGHFLQQ